MDFESLAPTRPIQGSAPRALEIQLDNARTVFSALPSNGLFANLQWRISPTPFYLTQDQIRELELLGRILLQFNRALNRLYKLSVIGKQPEWVARWLDLGKPEWMIQLQRSEAFKNQIPGIIRPDILLTDSGFSITELDSVPGGIGLTGWLNQVYSTKLTAPFDVVGGSTGMLDGFNGLFGDASKVHIMVSDESSTYRPEMKWLAEQIDEERFEIVDGEFNEFRVSEAIYRFFELFDHANVPSARAVFDAAARGDILLTPPPKPIFEEKMAFALLWNRNLRSYWRQEIGESFFHRLLKLIPYTWLIDPTPIPAHAAIPELGITDWVQLKSMSQKERDLIIKVSGFSPQAWGARGVHLGSDLSASDWASVVDEALKKFPTSPSVMQRYHKPKLVPMDWWNEKTDQIEKLEGRVRLCPYYFVSGKNDNFRTNLGGVLATVCPGDKKIIHGMRDSILAPVAPLSV